MTTPSGEAGWASGGHGSASTALWDAVDRLVDAAPGPRDLQVHGLHLLAARRWRALGKPVPASLAREELRNSFTLHRAPAVLAEIRTACTGPIVLIKGPAVAAHYPDASLRPFQDLDLIVDDADAVQRELLAAGFRPVGDPAFYGDTLHHLRPLQSPSFPLVVEVHRRPKWVHGVAPPSFEELMLESQPSSLGVEGIITPSRARHALVLAAHLWAHEPLSRALWLIDIAVMTRGVDAQALVLLAREWGLGRLWRTTEAILDAVLSESGTRPWQLRFVGRGLADAREQAVWEAHLGRCLAPFLTLPPRPAVASFGAAVHDLLRPQLNESWREKLARTGRQLAKPSTRRWQSLPEPLQRARRRPSSAEPRRWKGGRLG